MQRGNLDHPGLDSIHDAGHKAQPDAMTQLRVLKTKIADLLEHLAAIRVAVGVPAGGEGIHVAAKK